MDMELAQIVLAWHQHGMHMQGCGMQHAQGACDLQAGGWHDNKKSLASLLGLL
jgi:hypothetical protein